MDIKELDNCLRIVNYADKISVWRFLSESEKEARINNPIVAEILEIKNDYKINYVLPFKKELDCNLLHIESTQGKKDMLKYYLYQFVSINDSLIDFQKKLKKDKFRSGEDYRVTPYLTPLRGKKTIELTKDQIFILCIFDLVNLIVTEIQDSCFIFGILFFDISDELGFRCLALDFDYAFHGQALLPYPPGNSTEGTSYNIAAYELETKHIIQSKIEKPDADNKKPRFPFPEYLNTEYNVELAAMIKSEYKDAMGVELSIIMQSLERLNFYLPRKGTKLAIYEGMKKYFEWDIGAYNSIFNPKNNLDDKELLTCTLRLEEMMKSIIKDKKVAKKLDNA